MAKFNKSLLGNVAGLAIMAYIGVLLIQVFRHNYELKKQLDDLQSQVSQLTSERDDLKYSIQYYQTASFQEKEARAKLGLQQPGEGVIILPKSAQAQAQPTDQKPPKPKSNWQQWREFLFG